MSSITVINPSSHSYIPFEVQRELIGLELSLASPLKFQIVGPETAGDMDLRQDYESLCETSFAVSRAMMLHVATIKDRQQLIKWVKDTGVDMFFFTKHSCTYNP
jgi:hypothetical protein